jgi:hypothetical protein
VKIDDELHEEARRASAVMCRPINAQAEFWMKIGMLAEANPTMAFNDIMRCSSRRRTFAWSAACRLIERRQSSQLPARTDMLFMTKSRTFRLLRRCLRSRRCRHVKRSVGRGWAVSLPYWQLRHAAIRVPRSLRHAVRLLVRRERRIRKRPSRSPYGAAH